ncbi:leucine-rich repeat-containing protein 14 [Gouania willdenowi]|uniref:Leucine-rich repeat-containing protein 14-like n=1 Tax=Gouania willdenowi TaxID=441366 RepID=A0A8C5ND42_GOUWI|nr:leucine-rich repeat-containing protein 14-like [Gouania willdenowi]
MVLSLVSLCAREVVSDHSSSPGWLNLVPGELYEALLDAAFSSCRPLAVGELVTRWPERILRVGGRRKRGQSVPSRLCIQALLVAVDRGLSDRRCSLQVLDLCGLQGEEGGTGDPMGGWSLTVALCTMVVQASTGSRIAGKKYRERDRKGFLALERESSLKRERGQGSRGTGEDGGSGGCSDQPEEELERKTQVTGTDSSSCGTEANIAPVLVHLRADLFVNARSWDRVRGALSTSGPLKLQCRYIRVEDISVSNIRTLLSLLPHRDLLGVDIRYSIVGVSGLVMLLPLLSTFPALNSLCLHYCNLDLRTEQLGQEQTLRDLSHGLANLRQLRRLSLTALRLSGQLSVLLSSFPQPLEVLKLPYLSLSSSDVAYLSCSHHSCTLQQLDLSENYLCDNYMPSIRRLLCQASGSLQHLSMSGCGLTTARLGSLLPSIGACRALKSFSLPLNPLSMSGLLELVKMAVRMPSLRYVLYPNPLEDYQPGLPDCPTSARLLDWPLDESTVMTSNRLNNMLKDSGRSDLFLTCDLLNYNIAYLR